MLLNPYRFAGLPSALLTGLISYWKMDEPSGNALDSHGTNHLTNTNTVGTAAGKVGTARDFESSSTQYFTIPGNASLTTGDIEFTFTAWLQVESFAASNKILAKDDGNSSREFLLQQASSKLQMVLFPGGSPTAVTSALTLTTGVWYFMVFWHDPVANKMYLQVNNGAIDEAAVSGGTSQRLTEPFMIGAYNYTSLRNPFDGLIDEVGFWKRVLTPAERTQLYNAGNGLAYPFT